MTRTTKATVLRSLNRVMRQIVSRLEFREKCKPAPGSVEMGHLLGSQDGGTEVYWEIERVTQLKVRRLNVMTPPLRRVVSSLSGLPPISLVRGATTILFELACGHSDNGVFYPDSTGWIVMPLVRACKECPAVPEIRANDFLDGRAIPALTVVR